jgi:hypothetical protein
MNEEYTIAALQRQAARDAMRRRRQQTQRDDLLEAAHALLPDQGLALPYPKFAVHANVPRTIAAGLYNGTAELAAAYVTREIYRLIERTTPAEGASPVDFLAHLIESMRAVPQPHRVIRAMECGLTPRLLATAHEAELILARAVGLGLSEVWPANPSHAAPAIPPQATEDIGRRALALLHEAARASHPRPARAEAALIVEMLAPAIASRAAQAITDAAAPDAPRPEARSPAAQPEAPADAANDDAAIKATAQIRRDPAQAIEATPPDTPSEPEAPDQAWPARPAVGAVRVFPHPPDPPAWRGPLHPADSPAGLVTLRATPPPAPALYPIGAG